MCVYVCVLYVHVNIKWVQIHIPLHANEGKDNYECLALPPTLFEKEFFIHCTKLSGPQASEAFPVSALSCHYRNTGIQLCATMNSLMWVPCI